jgi:rSAM/selenodomain-associated transferase 2
VVIPCLDEGAIVRARLEALQPLRQKLHELILVDGGSRDGSPELARPLVDRVLVTDSGRAHQMNRGALLASGDILWFLHLDSQLPVNAAQAVRRFGTGACSWGRFSIRLSGRDPMFRVVERLMNWRSCLSGIATGDQGVFLSRELYLRVGGYPEIPIMEDIALSKRLKRHARPVCVDQFITTSSRRWERNGPLRTIALMWFMRLAYALGADPTWLAGFYRQCSSPRLEY